MVLSFLNYHSIPLTLRTDFNWSHDQVGVVIWQPRHICFDNYKEVAGRKKTHYQISPYFAYFTFVSLHSFLLEGTLHQHLHRYCIFLPHKTLVVSSNLRHLHPLQELKTYAPRFRKPGLVLLFFSLLYS